MRAAIDNGASLDIKSFARQGLLEVCQQRACHNAARELLKLGVDPNQRVGKIDDTLLHKCARQGDYGMTAILLEAGADPNIENKYHRLPLRIAEQKKHEYLATLLRSHGARVKTWVDMTASIAAERSR